MLLLFILSLFHPQKFVDSAFTGHLYSVAGLVTQELKKMTF